VEAVVAIGVAVGFLVVVHDRGAQRRAARLQGKRQHGGVAAGDRRAVPVSKPSAIFTPGPDGWARWTWLSMPPGMTSRPEASIARAPSVSFSATATILPPRTPTSARNVSEAVMTLPPRITRSNSLIAASPRFRSRF